MPVDYTPLLIIVVAIGLPIWLTARYGRRIGLLSASAEFVIFLVMILSVYAPAWQLKAKAKRGDPVAAYQLSKWYWTNWIARHVTGGDPSSSFRWLEKSADGKYAPALYTLGVMYKEGTFVPPESQAVNASVPHPQPQRGQKLIDEAIALGYRPTVPEEQYFNTVFTRAPLETNKEVGVGNLK
jgi:hypothetical protein